MINLSVTTKDKFIAQKREGGEGREVIQTKKRLDRIESQRIEHEKAAAASRFSIFNTLSRNSYEKLDGDQGGGVEEETRESTLDKEQREKEEKEQLERRLSTAPAALVLPPTNNTT